MKITIVSTSKVVEVNGVPARIWEGQTESGIAIHCFITRVGVSKGDPTEEFDREFQEHDAPSPVIDAYPLRMIL